MLLSLLLKLDFSENPKFEEIQFHLLLKLAIKIKYCVLEKMEHRLFDKNKTI
jgi:hypothetical protein